MRMFTGPRWVVLGILAVVLLVAIGCGDAAEPEEPGEVASRVVTPETPPGRELAQQVHDGETYTLVEYEDRLAVFSASGPPVTDPRLADGVLRSYAWGQVIESLDTDAMSDDARVIRDVDSSLSGVRETSNEMVSVLDNLESLGADIPLLGRVSAMDVLAETYPGADVAEDAIRSLDDELNSIAGESRVLESVVGHISAVDPAGVTGDDMGDLFGEGLQASTDMEARAGAARERVAEVRDIARDLEDALWRVSDTPVIGDTLGDASDTASALASELSGLADLLQDHIFTLATLSGRFSEATEDADDTHQGYVSRWLQEPHDDSWASAGGGRSIAVATQPSLTRSGSRPAATATPRAEGVSFGFTWNWYQAEGGAYDLIAKISEVGGMTDHGGVSISFPTLTEIGGSTSGYSSSTADVEVLDYSGGRRSNVTFHQPGTTIYHRDNRQLAAEYLLVETDEPSWSRSDDRVLVLRITPKRAGEFPVQVRGWLCADSYTECSRQPGEGSLEDQQGWAVQQVTVTVTTSTSTATQTQTPPTVTSQVASAHLVQESFASSLDTDRWLLFGSAKHLLSEAVIELTTAPTGSVGYIARPEAGCR